MARVDTTKRPAAVGDPAPDASAVWHVLVVDDDEVVHSSTDIALTHVSVEGRKLKVAHAYSAQQALGYVDQHPDLAVALVDVVMESPDAGLRLVREIRQRPGRAALRLILRTGQPGYAPELETIQDFDINDYWSKLEQTRTKLLVGLTTAIRSYRQFVDIEAQRDELRWLNRQLEAAIQAERSAVAARDRAEQALAASRDSVESEIAARTGELLETVHSLESFNVTVAHDLRGPLAGVSGMMNMIQRRVASGDMEQVPRWVGLVCAQTERLSALVGGLLELSKLARATPNRQPTSLEALARHGIDAVRAGKPGPSPAMAFHVSPMPTVAVDPSLLRTVFVNLVDNAAKFSRDAPGPTVRVAADVGDRHVVVSVADNGVGFDVAAAERLFEPLVRLHDGYDGVGLGLTTVKRIVAMHGGRIWAESAVGKGATFRFSLPIDAPATSA